MLAGLCFLLGGSLFAIGAFLAQTGAELVAVNLTYLVGGVFFSSGGWLSIVITTAHTRGRSSAVVLFVGTLFFAVSLVAAFAERADAPAGRQLDLASRHHRLRLLPRVRAPGDARCR